MAGNLQRRTGNVDDTDSCPCLQYAEPGRIQIDSSFEHQNNSLSCFNDARLEQCANHVCSGLKLLV